MKTLHPFQDKILVSILIAILYFQPYAYAVITVGQEQKIGRRDHQVNAYSNAWLGSNNTGYTFLGWVDDLSDSAREAIIRFQAYLNHAPYGEETIVHQDVFHSGASFPRGCMDNNGNVYLAWHKVRRPFPFYDLYFKRSSDSGQTWPGDPEQLNRVLNSVVEDIGEYTTTVGCDEKGNVYVLWLQTEQNVHSGNLHITHSADFGGTWSEPTRVNTVGDKVTRTFRQGRPVFAFGPKGRIHAAWLDERDSGALQIYYNYSLDQGATWPHDFHINQPYDNLEELSHVSLSADPRGNVYAAWEETRNDSAIYLRRSSDGGFNWQDKQRVNSPDPFGPHWTQSRSGNSNIAFDGQGSVYGFWRKNVHDHGDRVALNFSRDFGLTWERKDWVLDNEYSFDSGEMCVDGNGRIFVVHGKELKGHAGYHLFANVSRDFGATWDCSTNPEQCRLNNTTAPFQTANPRHFNLTCDQSGRASVIWYDHREGGSSPTGYFNMFRS